MNDDVELSDATSFLLLLCKQFDAVLKPISKQSPQVGISEAERQKRPSKSDITQHIAQTWPLTLFY
ncbi:hypothetical protein [Parasedimentitalea denitrificans]|uniref:hypothetical protein n=1 Tax=Parasedimentitalea denitrificans TaxID=2211118 RepID=UPI001430E73A|nr:hypothetical protein [Sedimentitalea sp. CY04]